jgi:glycosyltransferase involved in cell wall biosynthesis
MGKKTKKQPAQQVGSGDPKAKAKADTCIVSVVTPTYGRHRFLPWLLRMFNAQTFPQSQMELVIFDDGPDDNDFPDVPALLGSQKNVRFVRDATTKLTIGAKRNRLNDMCRGQFIVCMDDDDFYPPDRVQHAVDTLRRYAQQGVEIAGSSVMHIYFADTGVIRKFGPYGQFHATNGTFAYTKAFSQANRYDEVVAYGEESSFTRNFSIPLVQLDPFKVILCISHRRNTFDKTIIKTQGGDTIAKLKDFVKDKTLRDFYTSLVAVQDSQALCLPGTQQYVPIANAVDKCVDSDDVIDESWQLV